VTVDLGTAFLNAMTRTPEALRQGVEVTLHNRLFPRAARPADAPVPELPEVFRKLPDAILAELPFKAATAVPPGKVNKEKLFDLCDDSLGVIEQRYAECGQLMIGALACNIEVQGSWMADRQIFEAMKGKLDEWKDRLPRFEFARPRMLTQDLYRQNEMTIISKIHFGLNDAAHGMIKTLADALDALVDMEQVGVIEWTSEDTCQFHYFRNVLLGDVGAGRTEVQNRVETVEDGRGTRKETHTRTKTERDLTTTHRHARHIHELVSAKNLLLSAAGDVKRPGRVDALLGVIPEWLKPCMRVVTGKQTANVIIERDLRTDRSVDAEVKDTVTVQHIYRPDPAVVCGMYVLAGWSEDHADDTMPALPFQKLQALPPSK